MVNGINNAPEIDLVWLENLQFSIIPEVLTGEWYNDCHDIFQGDTF